MLFLHWYFTMFIPRVLCNSRYIYLCQFGQLLMFFYHVSGRTLNFSYLFYAIFTRYRVHIILCLMILVFWFDFIEHRSYDIRRFKFSSCVERVSDSPQFYYRLLKGEISMACFLWSLSYLSTSPLSSHLECSLRISFIFFKYYIAFRFLVL